MGKARFFAALRMTYQGKLRPSSLVPKLCLGTQMPSKLCFESQAELGP